MSIVLLLLQAAATAPSLTLAEAKSMSPVELADRLIPTEAHGPIVDAVINGRGLVPPSASVTRVWLVEQMVPFTPATCRVHVRNIEMGSSEAGAKLWEKAMPTHPVGVAHHYGLWVPPAGRATPATCAAAPQHASGFSVGTLGLEDAAALVAAARHAFTRRNGQLAVTCAGTEAQCADPRRTLARLNWSGLGSVEEVRSGDQAATSDAAAERAVRLVRFTFPFAARSATWLITVDRGPRITSVRMDAQMIIYH